MIHCLVESGNILVAAVVLVIVDGSFLLLDAEMVVAVFVVSIVACGSLDSMLMFTVVVVLLFKKNMGPKFA